MTTKKSLQRVIERAKENLATLAVAQYGDGFNCDLYTQATAGKSTGYANALIDEALALCGHPYYKFSNRRWSIAALVFLSGFTDV